jgi:signal transduction histidine kinase
VVRLASTFDHLVSELSRRMAHLETANREKDAFLSAASHELKTPLATLKLRVQSLQRTWGPSAAQGPRVEQLTRQVDRMTRLIHQMLDVAELSSGQLTLESTRFDLAQVVRAIAEEVVGGSTHHTLTLELSRAEGLGDRGRLEQVLFNLLHNAVKFSPEGGPVEVALRVDEEGTVALSVQDRGVGLAGLEGEELLRRFARGSQPGVARVGGLGVGLYLSRTVVELHGGTLTLEPREGGGAVACVRLPRWRDTGVGQVCPVPEGPGRSGLRPEV